VTIRPVTTRRDESIDERAAAWDARLRSPDCSAAEHAQFRAWLETDHRHRESYGRLQAALHAIRAANAQPQIRALLESARLLEHKSSRHRVVVRWAVAASVLITATGLALGLLHEYRPQTDALAQLDAASVAGDFVDTSLSWSTGPRERKTVALPDGTLATLNASTQLQTEWLPHERRIKLLAGEVLFRVAKDKTRPFIVTAGNHTVTALGTAFDVRLAPDKMKVTLLEGKVVVKGLHAVAGQPALNLEPSQQLVAVANREPIIQYVDVATESAWADGQVLFTDRALPDAVAEMNQYSTRQIVVNPELARYRINGMFRAGNQDGFVAALTAYFPVDVHEDSQGRLVLEARQSRQ
jgi:transmembrane sensor